MAAAAAEAEAAPAEAPPSAKKFRAFKRSRGTQRGAHHCWDSLCRPATGNGTMALYSMLPTCLQHRWCACMAASSPCGWATYRRKLP